MTAGLATAAHFSFDFFHALYPLPPPHHCTHTYAGFHRPPSYVVEEQCLRESEYSVFDSQCVWFLNVCVRVCV